MTGLPEGFESSDTCDCDWCIAWRRKGKAEAKRKEKIDPEGCFSFDSVKDNRYLLVRKSLSCDGVYIETGDLLTGVVISYKDARKIARVLKAMSK